MIRSAGIVLICFSIMIWAGAAAASDHSDINELLDRFEKAIAGDDTSAMEKCLVRKGFVQIYDYSPRGVQIYGIDGIINQDWLKSNRYVKFENRQITVDGNIAYVRCTENSLHNSGSNPHYKDTLILVKQERKWLIAVMSGRQLDF